MSQFILSSTRHALEANRDAVWTLLTWPGFRQRWLPAQSRVSQQSGMPGEVGARVRLSLGQREAEETTVRSQHGVHLMRESRLGDWHYAEHLWLVSVSAEQTHLHAHLCARPAVHNWRTRWRRPPLPGLFDTHNHARLAGMIAAGAFPLQRPEQTLQDLAPVELAIA